MIRFTGLFQKDWWLLRLDPKLCPLLNINPEITDKQSTIAEGSIGQKPLRVNVRCCTSSGTHRYSNCNACPFMVSHAVIPIFGTLKFSCKHYVDCMTSGVIYLWLCECGCYYIDKTIREFCIRVRKHLYAIDLCNLLSPLGCHRAMDHGYKQIWVCFTALDRVHPI